ncbi:MAG: YlxM family DNA-binding protein [Firmicutes bacterium]|nr:YlxM family DNA-binding protein [Bacillota bacterium]
MNFDNIAHVNLLFDFYGKLLTKRQKEAMELYYEENLSLSEIADEFQISRQGVHDALKNAEKALKGYEEKLGLVEKMQQSRQAMEEIDASIDELTAHCSDSAMAEKLQKIKTIIDRQLDQ